VTAAGRAIGAATCSELATAGHDVIATARDVTMLERLPVALRLPLDVTDDASIDRVLDEVGEIDAIVNNAALSGRAPLESFPIERLRSMMETNAFGALRVIQKLTPSWRQRGSGVIVNISSVQGRVATPLEGAYSATKFALEAISETLHYELGHFGIRVVIIQPGYIAPGMKESPDIPRPEEYDELYAQWEGIDTRLTGPSGRPGPELVGRAVVRAIEDADTPLRVPVGDDAALVLGVRADLSDADFEAAMRATTGLTW